MIETDCQKLAIQAVEEEGGRGLAFNSRFISGIPDLLIKLQGHEIMILEAKLHKFARSTIEQGYLIADVGCTKLQKDQLRDWRFAGVLTGVVSFVMEIDGDVRSLRMALYSHEEMLKRQWSIHTKDHTALGEKSERMVNIRGQLIKFARR
jgi:hypothetical protein